MRIFFERLLWGSRLSVMVGVFSCVLAALVTFVMGVKDVLHMFALLWEYLLSGSYDVRNDLVMVLVEILDTFLLGAVLLIFAFGLYELFIRNLEPAGNSDTGGKILIISSIDALKSKLGKVILMMLIIKVFSFFADIKPSSALDLLFMGGTVVLISLALMFSKGGKKE
ncbi:MULTISPECIES: YqhA family protein [Shewanella]|jgi:uncharacterized membrane protein YqhA|uniref:Predicted membrane protein n=4 Tax=Bacteria TaxID=2 RepID=A0A2T3H700_9GAMM|nr:MULTISPECIES: YqhA family protein [Shewanella]AXQ14762.1 hypothetical protein BS332_11130 [Shewanella algae]AYV12509.1 YqhA family protein [Shewanella algae]EKT4489362.1 YqhA family protein [Shewanella algae]MBC8797918.1 YqhA family protein [Shewanella algae]MBO2548445.1 YqhA family protein [Shewanella algae]